MSVAPDYRPTLKDSLIEALTDERDHYKRELGILRDREAESMMTSRLGLSPKEGATLMVLYARRGRIISRDAILTAVYGGMDEPDGRIIQVFICRVRKKIGEDKIALHWGQGYEITQAGVEAVEKAMTVGQC